MHPSSLVKNTNLKRVLLHKVVLRQVEFEVMSMELMELVEVLKMWMEFVEVLLE